MKPGGWMAPTSPRASCRSTGARCRASRRTRTTRPFFRGCAAATASASCAGGCSTRLATARRSPAGLPPHAPQEPSHPRAYRAGARLLDGIGLAIEIDGELVLDRSELASNAFEAAAAVGCAAHQSCVCGHCEVVGLSVVSGGEGEGEHEDEGEGEEGDDVDGGVGIDVDRDVNVDGDETDYEMDAGATAQQQALAAELQALVLQQSVREALDLKSVWSL